ncbi:Ig-like domain repeat protein [Granulicella cerasi]|uniref:Ig-like domain repeat protein n=1 Tax=Granulicella cerasi TaxID=741063 RepID=A0ABW1ZAZ5_9BACT|nr:Ig-like domain repeat protein [Granulicella cerasi]
MATALGLGSQAAHASAGQAFTLSSSTTVSFPSTAIGQTSSSQTVTLTANRAVTVASVVISSTMNSKQEFVLGTTSGCTTVVSGGTCSIPVTFKPFYSGTRTATLTVTDSTGTLYTVGLTGAASGPQGLMSPGYNTYSGPVGSGYSGDGGPLSAAKFYTLMGTTSDAAGNLYIADYGMQNIRVVYNSGSALACLIQIEEPTLFGLSAGATSCAGATSAPVAGNIYTIAGDTTAVSGTATTTSHTGGNLNNVLATTAGTLYGPEGVAVDAAGNILVSNYTNYSTSVVFAGGDSMACLIEMANPTIFGLTTGATTCAGATSAPQVGYIYKLIGTPGTAGITGDGGPLGSGTVLTGYGTAITVSPAGDIFFVSYSTLATRGTRIRVVYNGGAAAAKLIAAENPGTTPVIGYVYLVGGYAQVASAGDGGLATASTAGILNSRGLALTADGDVVFTEYTSATSAKIRVIYNGGAAMGKLITTENSAWASPTVGYLYTLAGNATPATSATVAGALAYTNALSDPIGVTTDPAGDIYYVDYGNFQLYKIDTASGKIVPYVGTGVKGTGNGNALTVAKYYLPWASNFGTDGTVYVTDYGVYHINVDTAAAAPITFTTTAAIGNVSETEVVYHNNVGNSPLTISGITASTNFAVVASGSTLYSDCTSTTVLQPGQTCAIGVALSPTVSNQTLTGTLTVTDNSSVGTYTVALTGTAAVATTTTLTSSANPSQGGTSITLSAAVAVASGQTVPTGTAALAGTVKFTDGTTTLATGVAIDATTGIATYTTAALANGSHSLKATFTPATADYSTSSGSLTQVVNSLTTTTTVTSSANPSAGGSAVTFTATVAVVAGQTAPTGAPGLAGTVTFTDSVSGAALASNVAIDATTGQATATTSALTNATHTITAVFTPATAYYATSTGTLSQVVSGITTSTTVTSTDPSPGPNTQVTLTATVAVTGTVPSGTTALSGTVTFVDVSLVSGSTTSTTTTLGTSTISSAGVATLPFKSSLVATHTITATFTPSTLYYASSAGTIVETVSGPTFTVANSNPGVAIPTGGSTTTTFAVSGIGGYSGTVSASCSGAPAYITCSFAPASTTFSGTSATSNVVMTIRTNGQTSSLVSRTGGLELASLLGFGVLLVAPRRRRLGAMLMLALGLALTATMTGCGNGTNSAARGTFNLTVNFTDGSLTVTSPVTVSITGN